MENAADIATAPHSAGLEISERNESGVVSVQCSGTWIVRQLIHIEQKLDHIVWPDSKEITLNCASLSALDITGAWLLRRTAETLRQQEHQVKIIGLRPEFDNLLQLVTSSATDTPFTPSPSPGLLNRIGQRTWQSVNNLTSMLAFIGESTIIQLQSLAHPHRIRWRAILHNLQSAGFEALPIVGLLSFLMGMVIAYQGATQLQRFGANIFIADLVGLSMLRELSPLLTAIIVAGRSGSAYAAQIGTMKVTEEIDALRTIGIRPAEILVIPKMLALIIALPLLTVYADLAGLLGGMVMAYSKLDVSFDVFFYRLSDAVSLASFMTGIGKTPVFAAIIALVGCYQGFKVTGSAESVGRQTTISVVQAIFLVIIADAIFSILFNWLKI